VCNCVLVQLEEQGVLLSLTDEVQKLRDEIDQAVVDASAKKRRRYRKQLGDDSGASTVLTVFSMLSYFYIFQ